MKLSHVPSAVSASFDEPNLVGTAGLEPAMRLAERCRLGELADELVRIPGPAGAFTGAKVTSIVAGMLAGADSIDDLDVVRHGALDRLFTEVRAPSTLGTHLRSYTWGHVRQLQKVSRMFLTQLARCAPLLPGKDILVFIDVDSKVKRVYGGTKQGAAFGYTGEWGLHPQVVTISTPLAVPVIGVSRMRGGNANSGRGAASLLTEGFGVARQAGCTGQMVARGDSSFYSGSVTTACRKAGAWFMITAKLDPAVVDAILAIPEKSWVNIKYPQAIWDEQEQLWISEAQIAEVVYTAFAGTRHEVTARLIVRRVKRLTPPPKDHPAKLPTQWRYHPCFTDAPFPLVQAEEFHRDHAIVEQVNADLNNSAAAHLPSKVFTANAAWYTLAALVHNLTRAVGALASMFHAKASTGTIRRHLIQVPARIASSAGKLKLHLSDNWPWEYAWEQLFAATHPVPT